jgi:predicted DNA-binding transcriptional regulator AlpA
MQPAHPPSTNALVIDGVRYFTAAHVARVAGVTRQTLWRWRQDGKVPPGLKYRDKQVVFTGAEVEQVREYAHRLEPIETVVPDDQLRLFGAKGGGRR